jgi:cell division protein FtsB
LIRKAAAGAAILAAAYFLLLGGEYTFLDLWRIDRAQKHEAAQLEAVRAEVHALQQRVDSLANDSATLERVARENYGLIKDGERLYRFVEPDTVAPALTPPVPPTP